MNFESIKDRYFSFKGAIGRWTYFCRSIIASFILGIIANICEWILIGSKNEGLNFIGAIVLMLVGIISFIIMLSLGVRRCHDLDKSGYLMILACIPGINIIFGLYLLFFKGRL